MGGPLWSPAIPRKDVEQVNDNKTKSCAEKSISYEVSG
jgi:hypothetical protein